ncbi:MULTISPECIES: hypothetical protein [Hyphobacterium]|uniref:ASCH domain-containing protein n=1 Tax=Hyphobacterium vulgare TaxID=1736751 RepID=A0ABV6ZUB4_9PROT
MTSLFELPPIALSVRQPWAWAICRADKDIENRSAAAVRHGMTPRRIAIHAAKGMTRCEYEDARDFMASIGVECPRPDALVRGAIIGAVTVTAIVAEHTSPWFFGPRGLVLEKPLTLGTPRPAVGQLGYFAWTESGAVDEPKPWMKSWPDDTKRSASPDGELPEPAPLLDLMR